MDTPIEAEDVDKVGAAPTEEADSAKYVDALCARRIDAISTVL